MEKNKLKFVLEFIRLNLNKVNFINISMVKQNVERTTELSRKTVSKQLNRKWAIKEHKLINIK